MRVFVQMEHLSCKNSPCNVYTGKMKYKYSQGRVIFPPEGAVAVPFTYEAVRTWHSWTALSDITNLVTWLSTWCSGRAMASCPLTWREVTLGVEISPSNPSGKPATSKGDNWHSWPQQQEGRPTQSWSGWDFSRQKKSSEMFSLLCERRLWNDDGCWSKQFARNLVTWYPLRVWRCSPVVISHPCPPYIDTFNGAWSEDRD